MSEEDKKDLIQQLLIEDKKLSEEIADAESVQEDSERISGEMFEERIDK